MPGGARIAAVGVLAAGAAVAAPGAALAGELPNVDVDAPVTVSDVADVSNVLTDVADVAALNHVL